MLRTRGPDHPETMTSVDKMLLVCYNAPEGGFIQCGVEDMNSSSRLATATWIAVFIFTLFTYATSASAAESNRYMAQVQISEGSDVIAAPRVVARVGQTAEVETSGSDGRVYRVDVSPKAAFTKNLSTTVAMDLRVLAKQESSDEWVLVASPRMMGNPSASEPMQLSTSIRALDDVELHIDVSVVPFDGDLSTGDMGSAAVDQVHTGARHLTEPPPTLMRTCGVCSGGGILCCTNGCCEEPIHGCGWVCDP